MAPPEVPVVFAVDLAISLDRLEGEDFKHHLTTRRAPGGDAPLSARLRSSAAAR